MISLVMIEWLFAILVLIIFTNRYVFGTILRFTDKRTAPSVCEPLETWPSVTIVTPSFNEGPTVKKTADSFAQLDYPGILKAVFIDDVSSDDTHAYLLEAQKEHPWIQVVLNPQNMGKRLSIKQAVLNADTDLILSVDSDVLVKPDALKNMVIHMHETKVDAVGGCVYITNANDNWITKMQAVKYWVGYMFLKNVENAFDQILCLSGCLTLYRREALLAIDHELESRSFLGDEVKYGEDRYLTRKLVEYGFKTRLTFTAECQTKAPNTIATYISQQLRWRRSNIMDLIVSTQRLHKLNPVVFIHYISFSTLLWVYPMMLLVKVAEVSFMMPLIIHTTFAAGLGLAYEFNKHKIAPPARTSGLWFILMMLMFPIIYLILTPLALATLGTSSWETRMVSKKNQSSHRTMTVQVGE